jgi:hypothetical protein
MAECDILRLLNELKEPPEEFTPIPFWFLNDALDKAELQRQLMDFRDKGVSGVVLHPRIGIPKTLPYLSEPYLEIMKYIVQTAKTLQMSIVLYDEAMYPSGSAHGEVVKANPAYASIGIVLTKDSREGKVIAAFEDGYYILQKPSGGTIRGIHFGEDDGEACAPQSADILNPAAVDKFIELTHERYAAVLGDYFGNTIIGFFTDEPSILGRCAVTGFEWTDGLERDITAAGGRLPELRALFQQEENETTRLYRGLVTARLNNVYYKKLSDWCAAHHIALMGHPKESGDIGEQMYFHVPGQDFVYRRFAPEGGGLDSPDSVQAKCSSDAARHSGKRRNSNECFGVCVRDGIPWYMTGGDMKWFIDYLGVRGVNLFIPHAFYYSLDGARKDERPPDVGPNNIWWPYYKRYSDYIKRVSCIMTDSINCAQTAVLCESGSMPVKELIPFYENQIEFNYLPLGMLENAALRGGKLCIGGYEYTYLMSPYETALPLKRVRTIADVGSRDFVTDISCPQLRVTHLIKYGVDLYFLTNEGTAPISASATVPVIGIPLYYDLWNGALYRPAYESSSAGTKLPIALKMYESLLIVLDKSGTVSAAQPPEPNIMNEMLANLRLESHDKKAIKKTYLADYSAESAAGNEAISVEAEEMVECFCNGSFAGVSFWNPHTFTIGSFLIKGQNQIKLIVTGSIANRYSNTAIPYGLIKE